jgi:HAD superfamily hydrolase (TIGR01549 family)
MSIKAVLFDLDGTLLPMDLDEFIKHYFGGLAKKFASSGYDPQELIKAIWSGVSAMKDDPERLNEESFWDCLYGVFGEDLKKDLYLFDDFYNNDFDKLSSICGYNEQADETIKLLKEKDVTIILATNPVFPEIATKKRMKWAGLDAEDFALVTTYENSKSIKPSSAYYNEILQKFGLKPEECIMVGNDVDDDMPAEALGLKVFLLTDCLINKSGVDISRYPNGGFGELQEFLIRNI